MVTVRLLKESDIPDVHAMWKEVDMSIGTHSIQSFLDFDPNGFYVAVDNGTVVGCCAIVVQNEQFATVGLYVVRPSHQGKGIGIRTWKKAMEHVGERNVFLNSVIKYLPTYRDKAGFTLEDRCKSVIWSKNTAVSTENLLTNVSGVQTQLVTPEVLEGVIKYDEHVVGYNRSKIITNVVNEMNSVSLVALRNGNVCGYGCLKDNILGTKLLGPLYADAPDIAELILRHLLQLMPSSEQCGVTFVAVDANPWFTALAQKLGLDEGSVFPRLYTKNVLDLRFEKVYGQLDLDLCHI